MAKCNNEKLFAEFPKVSTEQWESVINNDLKGADYQRKLVWRTAEGFNVKPYYRAEDLENIKFLEAKPGQFPYVRGTRQNNNWAVHQSVIIETPQQANTEAKNIIQRGVDSVGFIISEQGLSKEQLDQLLDAIDLEKIQITFAGKKIAATADLMLQKITEQQLDPTKVKMHFFVDPIVKNLSVEGQYSCGGEGEKCFQKTAELMKQYEQYKHIRIVTVQASYFANAGSTIVEELAFALAAGHEYIVRLLEEGITIDQIARKMRFEFSVSSNYFMEIAKFRAARLLWANIVKEYNPQRECAGKMITHAVTSQWNQTAYDPYVNMLRGTTEAMSATIAGVHSLEVLPFNNAYDNPDDFAKRIARNTELLLKHESHFDQVVDPAGGSYYVENLTQSIAEQAWKIFLQVEQKGGYREAFKQGFIVETIKKSAETKDKNIATRKQILLGANQYPNFTEKAGATLTNEALIKTETENKNIITPYRGAMQFEKMRFDVDKSQKELKAFMLTCGNLAMARARSQFACNFFACAGINVIDNTYFKSVEEGVKEAQEQKANIVVICAADDDYITVAPQVKKLINNDAIVVVAGAPASAQELEKEGITNFINVKSNVLESLKTYLKELGM